MFPLLNGLLAAMLGLGGLAAAKDTLTPQIQTEGGCAGYSALNPLLVENGTTMFPEVGIILEKVVDMGEFNADIQLNTATYNPKIDHDEEPVHVWPSLLPYASIRIRANLPFFGYVKTSVEAYGRIPPESHLTSVCRDNGRLWVQTLADVRNQD